MFPEVDLCQRGVTQLGSAYHANSSFAFAGSAIWEVCQSVTGVADNIVSHGFTTQCYYPANLASRERKPDDKDSINLGFSIESQFQTTITSVRVLSKWRHLSHDKRSALDITEVEQLELQCKPARPGMSSYEGEAHAWKAETRKKRLAMGEAQRWYEASVSSVDLEKLLEQNKSLKTGEKAQWSLDDLSQKGILESLCCPALQMLKDMDQVGGLEDNKQGEKPGTAVKRANDGSSNVPGSQPASNSAASGQREWSKQSIRSGGW